MSALTTKTGPAFILSAVTCVLGLAGLVTMIISSTMNRANALFSLPMLVVLAVIGIALTALAIFAPALWNKNNLVSLVAVMATIALFTTIIGNVINSRILLISGLFSYNAGNVIGWNVFYITVASIVCFLLSILLLIVGAFTKSHK